MGGVLGGSIRVFPTALLTINVETCNSWDPLSFRFAYICPGHVSFLFHVSSLAGSCLRPEQSQDLSLVISV